MILRVEAEITDVIPPKVWGHLKHAFVAIAAQYGVRVQIANEYDNEMEADRRYFDWVGSQEDQRCGFPTRLGGKCQQKPGHSGECE